MSLGDTVTDDLHDRLANRNVRVVGSGRPGEFLTLSNSDGARATTQKCTLLAEEREPRAFHGFWTDDPSTVDYINDHLKRRYGMCDQ